MIYFIDVHHLGVATGIAHLTSVLSLDLEYGLVKLCGLCHFGFPWLMPR